MPYASFLRYAGPFSLVLVLGALLVSNAGCQRGENVLDLEAAPVQRWIEAGPLEGLETEELDAESARALGGQAFEVELGHEVRRAVVQAPEASLTRMLRAPAGGRMRLAVGALEEGAVRFSVSLGGEELWSHERVSPRNAWHEAEIEIPPISGPRALELESTADGPTRRPVFWAHPTLRSPDGLRPGPAVLLISVDTLRADRLSVYGYDRPTSPRIDAWSRGAAVFEHAVAAAPWTLPSHVSMLTGINALRHGINHDVGRRRPDLDQPGAAPPRFLAEILQREGYATAAVTGGAYMHPRYGFSAGFDSYAYWPDRGRSERELATGVDRALDFMADQGERPFFFFLHTYDVHDPYPARQPYFSQLAPELGKVSGRIALESPANSPEQGFRQVNRFVLRQGPAKTPLDENDRDLIDAFYDSNVAHADFEIGRLLEGMRELGLDRRTVVILTSDHGEALLEGGSAGHVELYDHTLLVPLILALPDGLGRGRRLGQQVRSVDLVPTLLDWLGLDLPPGLDGVSLVDLLAGRPTDIPADAWSYSAAANRGLSLRYNDQLKVMLDNNAWRSSARAPSTGRHQVFDLGRDPTESTPLHTAEADAWHQRAAEYFEQVAVGLRLRLQNSGTGRLNGSIRGPMVRPVGTKSHDLDCDCLQWVEMEHATFDLPPGKAFTLHFEKVFGRHLRLEGVLERGGESFAFDETFDVRNLGESHALAFDGSRWRFAAEPTDGLETGFVVRWNGGVQEHGASPAESDPELRKQLEALGYL